MSAWAQSLGLGRCADRNLQAVLPRFQSYKQFAARPVPQDDDEMRLCRVEDCSDLLDILENTCLPQASPQLEGAERAGAEAAGVLRVCNLLLRC